MGTEPRFGPGSRFLITTAAAMIVVAGLRAAASILVPLVLYSSRVPAQGDSGPLGRPADQEEEA